MFFDMITILKRKYPLKSGDWKCSILQALIVFLILYLLKPFGLDKYGEHRALFPVCMGYAIITFLVEFFYQNIIRVVAQSKGTWTVADVLISGLFFWLFIGIVNFVYSIIVFDVNVEKIGLVLIYFIYCTILIGIFLTIVSTLVGYNRYLKSELLEMKNKTTEEQKGIFINIHDNTAKTEGLKIAINDFLYAESMKNDIVIWYLEGGEVVSRNFRMTMSQLKTQLPYENIFQCHRSFVINVNNISDSNGNANGYKLRVGSSHVIIPVSRPNVPLLKEYLS